MNQKLTGQALKDAVLDAAMNLAVARAKRKELRAKRFALSCEEADGGDCGYTCWREGSGTGEDRRTWAEDPAPDDWCDSCKESRRLTHEIWKLSSVVGGRLRRLCRLAMRLNGESP